MSNQWEVIASCLDTLNQSVSFLEKAMPTPSQSREGCSVCVRRLPTLSSIYYSGVGSYPKWSVAKAQVNAHVTDPSGRWSTLGEGRSLEKSIVRSSHGAIKISGNVEGHLSKPHRKIKAHVRDKRILPFAQATDVLSAFREYLFMSPRLLSRLKMTRYRCHALSNLLKSKEDAAKLCAHCRIKFTFQVSQDWNLPECD